MTVFGHHWGEWLSASGHVTSLLEPGLLKPGEGISGTDRQMDSNL